MKKLNRELLHSQLLERYAYDPITGHFTHKVGGHGHNVGDRAGGVNQHNRRKIYFDGKLQSASRLAIFYVTGRWPKHQVDHKNHDTLDDSWNNLREATASQNCANKRSYHKPNSCGYRGVKRRGTGRFQAAICVARVNYSLGYFGTADRAALAYDMAAKKYHGKFALFNFPEKAHRDWLVVS